MATFDFSLGFEYTTFVEVTPLIPRDEQGKPAVNEKVYLDKVYLSYIDSGPLDVINRNNRTQAEQVRPIRSDYGQPIGQLPIGTVLPVNRVYTETGRRQVMTRGRAEDIAVEINTRTPLDIRIAAVSQTGTIIPQV